MAIKKKYSAEEIINNPAFGKLDLTAVGDDGRLYPAAYDPEQKHIFFTIPANVKVLHYEIGKPLEDKVSVSEPKEKENTPEQTAPQKTTDKAAIRAELQSKVKDIANNFKEDPTKIAEYLSFATRFYQYSPNNVRLIWCQRPGATFVASAKRFFEGMPDKDGNKLYENKVLIKKGEHALYIWKPTSKTEYKADGMWMSFTDLTKDQRALAKSGQLESRTWNDFVFVPVFDITQTTMPTEMYPKLLAFGSPSQSADATSAALIAYSQNELKCPVTVENFGGESISMRGYFMPALNKISLSDMISGDEKLSTLIHEIGHASLHADTVGRADKSVAQIELEADMYALMVQQHFGIEVTDQRKAHLADHYKKWLSELPADKQNDINADMPIFKNVCDRYGQTVDKLDEYVQSYGIYESIDRQTEEVKQNTPDQVNNVTPTSAPEQSMNNAVNDPEPSRSWNISI